MPSSRKQQKKGAPKLRRVGNSHTHAITRYYAGTYPARKLRRILRSNGYPQAQSWADTHQANAVLLRIRKVAE